MMHWKDRASRLIQLQNYYPLGNETQILISNENKKSNPIYGSSSSSSVTSTFTVDNNNKKKGCLSSPSQSLNKGSEQQEQHIRCCSSIDIYDDFHHDDTATSTNSSVSGEIPVAMSNQIKKNQSFDSIQLIAMLSNFSTSYNVVNISLVLPILKEFIISRNTNINMITSQQTSIVASSLLFGMMIGQIMGGALGDIPHVGKLNALRVVMIIQIIASIASSICIRVSSSSTSAEYVFIQLALWRLLLGIGAGGVYPLAAVLSVEHEQNSTMQTAQTKSITTRECHHEDEVYSRYSSHTEIDPQSPLSTTTNIAEKGLIDTKNKVNDEDNGDIDTVHRVVLTFSTQGAGFIAVPILSLCFLYLFPENLNLVWRLLLGVGCIPGSVMLIVASTRHKACDRNNANKNETSFDHSYLIPINDHNQLEKNPRNTRPIFRLFSYQQLNAYDEDSSDISESEYTHFLTTDHVIMSKSSSSNYSIRTFISKWWESIRHEENVISKLIGSAGVWFLFDVLFYGNTLFQPIVIQAIFGSSIHHDMSPIHLLQQTSIHTLLLTMMAVPGYIVASNVISSARTLNNNRNTKMMFQCDIARTPKYVMLQGFLMMTFLYLVIGTMWNILLSNKQSSYILIVMYGLTFFFSNYGPNTSTFILPSLIYSKRCRSSLNGVSAACGKLGAFIGAMFFDVIVQKYGNETAMIMCSAISFISFIITIIFVPNA